MTNISASIVLYHNKKEQVKKAIDSFLNTELEAKLYLVDNSETDELKELAVDDERIKYIFNNANLGYGTAHNIAMRKSIDASTPYHLVLNPDIYFKKGVLESLYAYMEQNKDVGNIMPKILYPNSELQYLCKLLPSPFDLIFRRFIPLKNYKEKHNQRYELRYSGYNSIMNVPALSGCFMFLRTASLKEVGLFDERFFMYLEDVDLNRRIHERYKTIFYPDAEVYHEYAKDSYKNRKLLTYHIRSAFSYFNKWGWIMDYGRRIINNKVLKKL